MEINCGKRFELLRLRARGRFRRLGLNRRANQSPFYTSGGIRLCIQDGRSCALIGKSRKGKTVSCRLPIGHFDFVKARPAPTPLLISSARSGAAEPQMALFWQCAFDCRNCLRSLYLGSVFLEMNSVLESIEVMHHQFVLIVNGQARLLDECFRNRIS